MKTRTLSTQSRTGTSGPESCHEYSWEISEVVRNRFHQTPSLQIECIAKSLIQYPSHHTEASTGGDHRSTPQQGTWTQMPLPCRLGRLGSLAFRHRPNTPLVSLKLGYPKTSKQPWVSLSLFNFTTLGWFWPPTDSFSIIEQKKTSETLKLVIPGPRECLLAEWQRGNKRKQQNWCLAMDIATTFCRTGNGCQRTNSQYRQSWYFHWICHRRDAQQIVKTSWHIMTHDLSPIFYPFSLHRWAGIDLNS